jgi:hypothetical protein
MLLFLHPTTASSFHKPLSSVLIHSQDESIYLNTSDTSGHTPDSPISTSTTVAACPSHQPSPPAAAEPSKISSKHSAQKPAHTSPPSRKATRTPSSCSRASSLLWRTTRPTRGSSCLMGTSTITKCANASKTPNCRNRRRCRGSSRSISRRIRGMRGRTRMER